MGPNQTNKPLHSKGNHKTNKQTNNQKNKTNNEKTTSFGMGPTPQLVIRLDP